MEIKPLFLENQECVENSRFLERQELKTVNIRCLWLGHTPERPGCTAVLHRETERERERERKNETLNERQQTSSFLGWPLVLVRQPWWGDDGFCVHKWTNKSLERKLWEVQTVGALSLSLSLLLGATPGPDRETKLILLASVKFISCAQTRKWPLVVANVMQINHANPRLFSF